MPTLASMFGAVDLPPQPQGNVEMSILMMRRPMREMPDAEQQQIELQKGILMQTAIGK